MSRPAHKKHQRQQMSKSRRAQFRETQVLSAFIKQPSQPSPERMVQPLRSAGGMRAV